MTRKAVVTLAAVALTAGVFVSGASAAPPLCGSKPCAEEIQAECGVLSGADFRACKRAVLQQCKVSNETSCSCTNPALPPCVLSTTTTTFGTTTTTSTTTTSTNPCSPIPCETIITCCKQSTPGGPFDQCTIETFSQCLAAGGRVSFGQGCTPNPCETTTTSSTATTTTTGLPDCRSSCLIDPDNTITTIPRGVPVDVPVRVQNLSPSTWGTFDIYLVDNGAGGTAPCAGNCFMVPVAPGGTTTVHFTYTAAATAPAAILLTVTVNPHSVGFTCGFGSSPSSCSKPFSVSP